MFPFSPMSWAFWADYLPWFNIAKDSYDISTPLASPVLKGEESVAFKIALQSLLGDLVWVPNVPNLLSRLGFLTELHLHFFPSWWEGMHHWRPRPWYIMGTTTPRRHQVTILNQNSCFPPKYLLKSQNFLQLKKIPPAVCYANTNSLSPCCGRTFIWIILSCH